ncbi:bacillithiol system redox-active protein YtxJ [Paenibacillus sp. JNUCC31]|uniref:bacillithiol system redox-active protein YtxJ n=1 Tax=Paenibacillus sp. JNUCC-31 TaxID=2777983 RepID=UPI00177B3E4C|nr:bacillithiol system redox-active protein YtxJ [Paenibacillus sp. JNUCC-31]QOS80138.1 bacillithiol system redox-active protein YtxJ [Paenibacillus sp. JNUCC-31]
MADMTKMTSIEQLNSAVEATEDQPLLLFKHSTRCPISASAYQEMNDYLQNSPSEQVQYGIIYVVEDRPVSNEAADKLGVKHESPQAILVKKGIPVWHTSHSNITSTTITNALRES